MIRMQIVERSGTDLYKTLIADMRSGSLRTFQAKDRGKKIQHVRYPGYMKWSNNRGVILCEIVAPREPGTEWQFFSAFIGRLAHRYGDMTRAITVEFEAQRAKRGGPVKKKARSKR